MALLRIVCGLFLAAALGAVFFQRQAVSKVRQEHENLLQQKEEAARLVRENGGISRLRVDNQELEALRIANQDLLKLRNEVRQLRDGIPEAEKLRQENQRLVSEINLMAEGKPLRLAQMPDCLAKETWSNAGFATPEAALQTFFWAIREGRFEQIADCFSPEERKRIERQFAQKSDEERKQTFREWAEIGGYRIAEKGEPVQDTGYDVAVRRGFIESTPPDPETVVLGIQAAAGGAVIKWHLKRFGNEWKIEDW
jgi:hypothetical protein